MANTYLTRQISSAGSRKKATISLWVKRGSDFGNDQRFFSYENTSVSNNVTVFKFSGDSIQFADQTGGSNNARYDGTRKLRDNNSWYHFLVKMDTTQSTNTDRLKVYINGELQSEASYTYPTQNADLNIGHNANAYIDIGRWRGSNNQYFNGCISHFHYTDGYAYDASTFGSTDSVTGEWKINTSPSITMGTNGFTILKDGNTITDQSANSNNFTLGGGTLTNTEDCPSNVFATLNPLHKGTMLTGFTFANGNNTFTAGSTNFPFTCSTIAVSSGKYYAEFKTTANANQIGIGISAGVASAYIGHNQYDYAYYGLNGNIITNQTSNTTYGTGLSTNDILGVALDATNSKLYFSVNGSWQNSANPSSGTGGFSITAPSSTTTGVYHFALGDEASSTPSVQCNFGSGYFGTTAISSEGSNASGIGKFEYDVPTGYTALSTKGLNL
nr:lectin-like protein [uncultured Mediterranean phage uvMED]